MINIYKINSEGLINSAKKYLLALAMCSGHSYGGVKSQQIFFSSNLIINGLDI